MELPQLPPGGGGKERRVHFGYTSPKRGKNFHAWIAGPAMWFECHTDKKSQPCLHEMTKGELACVRCERGEGSEEQGYLPLYLETNGKPAMVIVKGYTRDKVDLLKLHQRVLVGRDEDIGSSVYVIPALKPEPRFQTTLAARFKPASLTETLLRVWRLPELVEWMGQTHKVPTPKAPKGPVPKRGDGSEFSPMMRAAAARAYTAPAETDESGLGNLIDSIRDKTKGFKSGTNGHHKPSD